MPSPPFTVQSAHFLGEFEHPTCRAFQAWSSSVEKSSIGPQLSKEAQVTVAPSNSFSLKELHELQAHFSTHSGSFLLILAEDRGLAGCDELLRLPNVSLVPFPWSLDLFDASASKFQQLPSSTQGQVDWGEYLSGAVEGLRDPLTSLSGYLQLMEGESSGSDLTSPALKSAKEMELVLEAVLLSTGQVSANPNYQALRPLGKKCVQQGVALGRALRLNWDEDCAAEIDRRFFLSTLFVSLLFAERFGPGCPLQLLAQQEEDYLVLLWVSDKEDNSKKTSRPQPPLSFLPETLRALTKALHGTPLVQKSSDGHILGVGFKVVKSDKRPKKATPTKAKSSQGTS
ncbi:MAG: hypothetical protein QGH51_00895 [Planctomycetota bacterium]|jgi:hypothetical protein|nr:hypothetical protein [Planctomycetota bacterium]